MNKRSLRFLHSTAAFVASILLLSVTLSCSMAPLQNDIEKFVDTGTATERIGKVTLGVDSVIRLTEDSWAGSTYYCKVWYGTSAITVVPTTGIDMQQLSYQWNGTGDFVAMTSGSLLSFTADWAIASTYILLLKVTSPDGKKYRIYTINFIKSYKVTYVPNGATSGITPAPALFASGEAITMPENTGGLASPSGTVLFGWNTLSDGTGTEYRPGSTALTMATTDLSLYAILMPQAVTEYLFTNGSLIDTSGGGHDLTHTYSTGAPVSASLYPASFVPDRHGANLGALLVPSFWAITSDPVDSLKIGDTATFSCSFWFRSALPETPGGAIVFLENPVPTMFGFYVMNNGSTGNKYVEICATSSGTGNFLYDAPITFAGGKTDWIHVACIHTYTSGTRNLDIYVNGTQYAGNLTMGHIDGSMPSTGIVRLGGIANGYYYSGDVDDVRFYRSVLTLTQINALRNE